MSIFKNTSTLFGLLGSFWTSYFQDRDFIHGFEDAQEAEGSQVYFDFLQRVAAVSRFDIPVFRKEYWVFLPLRKSAENAGNASVIKYGDASIAYGDGSVYGGFGKPKDYIYDLPSSLKKVSAITNRLTNASVTWMNGTDFYIDTENDALVLSESPFDNPLIPQRLIVDERGEQVDREVGLWAYMGEWDLEWIWDRFGFAVKLWMETSDYYKELVNVLWDMRMFGASERWFRQGIAALSGVPCVIETVETVLETVEYPVQQRRAFITDQHVYLTHINSTPLVSVGDVLHNSDILVDTWQMVLLNRYTYDASGIDAVAVGSKFLSGGYRGALVFNNVSVDLEYHGLDSDGKAFVTFEVGGYPQDAEDFWYAVQEKGKEPGNQTLAELLDLRSSPAGQPGPGDLPVKINPLEFVLDNIFRNNLFIVKVKPQHFLNPLEGLQAFQNMRDLIPANTTFILIIALEAEDEYEIDTEEAVSLLTALSLEDTIDVEAVEPALEDGRIKFIGGDLCNV